MEIGCVTRMMGVPGTLLLFVLSTAIPLCDCNTDVPCPQAQQNSTSSADVRASTPMQGPTSLQNQTEANKSGSTKKSTLCVLHKGRGGFGNRMVGLALWSAFARMTGRSFAFQGPGIIWKEFWESDFDNNPCKKKKAVQCTTAGVVALPSPACQKAIFELRDQNVFVTSGGNQRTLSTYTGGAWPRFVDTYRAQLAKEFPGQEELIASLHVYTAVLAMELPQIMRRPKPPLQNAIAAFEKSKNISISTHGALDLCIHVRKCVDCGWEMSRKHIMKDLECLMGSLPEESRGNVFVTSDSRESLHVAKSVLKEATFYEDLPPKIVHTANSGKHADRVLPYLDNYIFGQCTRVGTCYTSYPQVGIFRTGGLERAFDVIRLMHHTTGDRSFGDKTQPGGAACWPLMQTRNQTLA